MRKIAVLTALAVALVFGIGVAVAAPPDKMEIKEIQKVKAPVAFDHKAHTGIAKDCKTCHHADAAGKEQKCSKCHTDKTEGKKLSLKEAFHKQCKDCHTKQAKGPTKCDGCHPKK
ncbi:MAG: cytochrome c3 family protein [Deltaproteobacteria bacterium]|nr:cytochrome c3 family protein [Deltaproteobacteria bacterium]